MSEPRKNSRNMKDVQLVVSCLTPKKDEAEDHNTSVYEIDIRSAFDVYKHGVEELHEKYSDTTTKGLAKDSEVRREGTHGNEGTQENEGTHENASTEPVVESHCQNEAELLSDDQRQSRVQNVSFKVQPELLGDTKKEKERKSGKANKKWQSAPTENQREFQKHIKNYIIENFIGGKNGEMKSIVQNYHDGLDNNAVHLHHHEHHHHHHHHYYNNVKALETEKTPLTTDFKDKFSNSPNDVLFATLTSSREQKELEAEECYSYSSNGPDMTDEFFEIPSSTSEDRPELEEFFEEFHSREDSSSENRRERPPENPHDTYMVLVNKKSSKNVQSSLMSLASTTSTDVIFVKDSKHSSESVVTDNYEIQGIKIEKNKSSKTYASLMENFRNLNNFMSPIVITDQKTLPKIFYIRCECAPWKDTALTNEAESYSRNENSEETDDPDRLTDDRDSMRKSETATGRHGRRHWKSLPLGKAASPVLLNSRQNDGPPVESHSPFVLRPADFL